MKNFVFNGKTPFERPNIIYIQMNISSNDMKCSFECKLYLVERQFDESSEEI